MNFLSVLGAIIAPLENWAEQKLASIGSAFLSAMGVVFNTFTNDQRAIGASCTAYWQAQYHAKVAAGSSELVAIEEASTATLNEFFNQEKADLVKVVSMTVTALEVSVANGLKP